MDRVHVLLPIFYPTYNNNPTPLKNPLDFVRFMLNGGMDPKNFDLSIFVRAGDINVLRYLHEEGRVSISDMVNLADSFPYDREDKFSDFYSLLSEGKGSRNILVGLALKRRYYKFLDGLTTNIMDELLKKEPIIYDDNYALLFQLMASDSFMEHGGETFLLNCEQLISKFDLCKEQTEQCKNNYTNSFLLHAFANSIIKRDYSSLQNTIESIISLYGSKPYSKARVAQQIRALIVYCENSEIQRHLQKTIEGDLKIYDELLQQTVDAITTNNMDALKKLLLDGFDVNAQDTAGFSLLHLAILRKRIPMVELLLKNGAEVNTENKHGVSPLKTATIMRLQDIITLLKNKGAI